MNRIRCFSALAAMMLLVAGGVVLKEAAATQEPSSLLQMIEQWKYPGSKMVGGATMSDGGNPEIEDLKCRTVLTTPDPFEAVVRFYDEKTGEGPDKSPEARAVQSQDDSQDRPVAVKVISVHRLEVSTTLVITRGEKEKETHIAWSQYRRFPRPR